MLLENVTKTTRSLIKTTAFCVRGRLYLAGAKNIPVAFYHGLSYCQNRFILPQIPEVSYTTGAGQKTRAQGRSSITAALPVRWGIFPPYSLAWEMRRVMTLKVRRHRCAWAEYDMVRTRAVPVGTGLQDTTSHPGQVGGGDGWRRVWNRARGKATGCPAGGWIIWVDFKSLLCREPYKHPWWSDGGHV